MRTQHGEVAMCTSYLERIHHEANDECVKVHSLVYTMSKLIEIETRGYGAANQLQSRQARSEFNKLANVQNALSSHLRLCAQIWPPMVSVQAHCEQSIRRHRFTERHPAC
jgi:hypothetical protein